MKITYYTKSVYGVNKHYISEPEIAKQVQELTGQKTITEKTIIALKKLGHEIKHQPKY